MWSTTEHEATMPGDDRPKEQQSSRNDCISFTLNGEKHSVYSTSERYSVGSSLSDYIRDAGLTGTKLACGQGGCGACAVLVSTQAADGGSSCTTQAINACLCPLFSVDGWHITTVEGVGSEKQGYNAVQRRLAEGNASQCGFCTPGIVMAMCSVLHGNPQPTEQDIEDNLDGNLCRCTGYRAILESMKSFAVDSSSPNKQMIDIEDLDKKLCPETRRPCSGDGGDCNHGANCTNSTANSPCPASQGVGGVLPAAKPAPIQVGGTVWVRPQSLHELGDLLCENRDKKVKMVFGNTSTGIFKTNRQYDVMVDIRCVKEMSGIKVLDTGLHVGANTTLSLLLSKLKDLQTARPGFAYFQHLVEHLKLVGSVMIRNAGSVGGNLYIKHAYPSFPSDVFTMLEAAGATVSIYDSSIRQETLVSLEDMVRKVDMKGKVLTSVHLPNLHPSQHFRSFKVSPRAQNSHAYVNAAFKMELTEDKKRIVGTPNLVFGGIDDKMIHASRTEKFLTGKEITTEMVKECMMVLKSELKPFVYPLLASSDYRRDLAANLLYKTFLGLVTPSDPRLESGCSSLQRSVSQAFHKFDTIEGELPLKQPIPKLTSLLQTSGEAVFVNDLPRLQHELCAAFVMSSVASGRLGSVDPAPALAMPGVVRYLSASNIPGKNVLAPWANDENQTQEILSSGKLEYAGQPIGVILANSQRQAEEAAQKVVVKYTDVQRPILTIKEGIAANSFHPVTVKPTIIGDPDRALKEADNVLEGEVTMGTQYHFYLENQVSLCVPSEDGIEMYSSTQYADLVQAGVAGLLGKPANYVNMHVPRLGGAFGGKHLTSMFPAGATALGATCTNRPVRMSLNLTDNMILAGKRYPVMAKYKVGFSTEGKLQVVIVDVYIDSGFTPSHLLNDLMVRLDHGYFVPNWKLTPYEVRTNKPTIVACRSPGPVPALLIIETIIEHVAKSLNKHPILVREVNLYEKHQTDLCGHVLTYCTMKNVWSQLKTSAKVDTRLAEIEKFNQLNQWRKRGLTMSAIKHGLSWPGSGFPAQVSIFASDGTVVVSQAGVEMGQGLYTKVAQATAHALGIPVSMVKVRPNQSLIANNAFYTGGTTTSEQCVYAVQQCCKTLQERLAPVRDQHPDADWVTLCQEALKANVDLGARYTRFGEPGCPYFKYFVYCAGVYETELDVLTGEYLIRQVDILFDLGESLNPLIDVGQIEGGFVMGLGCHLMEDIVYDDTSGRILNARTWNYNVPSAKDIPVKWNIHLLPNAPNPVGINSSKGVGEPPVAMGCGPLLALKQCMEAAVLDLTGSSTFIPVDSPMTLDKIQQGCKVGVQHLRL